MRWNCKPNQQNYGGITMKKIVLLALCLVSFVFILSGCSSSESFEEKSYTPDVQIVGINLDVEDREIKEMCIRDRACPTAAPWPARKQPATALRI